MGLFSRTKSVDIFFIGCEGTEVDRGIYSFYLDLKTGEIIKKRFVSSKLNPLAMAPHGRFMAITYRNSTGRVMAGGISQYSCIEHQLGLVSTVANEGKSYICTLTNDDVTFTYAVDYYNGEIIKVKCAHKKFINVRQTIVLEGHSVHPIKQTEPHPTYITYAPDKKIIVTDLGADKILVFDVDETGDLVLNEDCTFKMPEGAGPRKILFSQDGYAYILGEISSKVYVYKYEEGHFTFVQEVLSYLPEEFDGENVLTDGELTENNRYLVVTNKGDDTVVVFKRDFEDGTIHRIDCMETDAGPSGVHIFHDKYFVIMSKSSGSIESFELKEGEKNGIIFETHSHILVHGPSCIYTGLQNYRVVV